VLAYSEERSRKGLLLGCDKTPEFPRIFGVLFCHKKRVGSFLPPLVTQEKGGKKCLVFGSEVYEELGQLGQGRGLTCLVVSPIQGNSLL